MSNQPENDDVIISDAIQYTGRRKGRKHDKFTLPSGEAVQIYYVTLDALPTGYYPAGLPKAFYAQIAGKAFHSDTPTDIQPAIIKYLSETKPVVMQEVITTSTHVHGETISLLHLRFTRGWYGVRGDGKALTRDAFDKDIAIAIEPHTWCVPFTEKRWTNIKSAKKTLEQILTRLETLRKMHSEDAATFLESQPVIDIIESE